MQEIRINDIFVCSWGYDQTNVDFYQLVRVISEKTIEVRLIASREINDSEVMPIINEFIGDKFRRHLRKFDKHIVINGICSFMSAFLWDGNPCYQTPFGQGH